MVVINLILLVIQWYLKVAEEENCRVYTLRRAGKHNG